MFLSVIPKYSSKREYDGQNHIVKVTDARGYITQFQYDGNHNLIKTTNALTQSTNFKYDSQFPFRLTDTIDPLNHGTFIDYDTEHHITLTRACNYSGTTCSPVIADDGNEIKSSATYYPNGLTVAKGMGSSLDGLLPKFSHKHQSS